jgi:hypothetical protein
VLESNGYGLGGQPIRKEYPNITPVKLAVLAIRDLHETITFDDRQVEVEMSKYAATISTKSDFRL